MSLFEPLNALPAGVLVACSGGRDSVALLHACVVAGRAPRAITIDHGLGDHGAEAVDHVAQLCKAWGVPHRGVRVQVTDGAGPEDAARRARYAALDAEAQRIDAPAIALAHTADDQIETVLMRLVDGAGAAGLAGMPATRGLYRRPWLGVRRAAVTAYADAHALRWHTDPTNAQLDFRRNRVRHLLVPAFADTFGTGWATGLLRTAALSRHAAAAQVARLAPLQPQLQTGRIEIAALDALGPADRRAALLLLCAPLPPRRHASAVDSLSALLDRPPGAVQVDLPGSWRAERAYGYVAVRPLGAPENEPASTAPLKIDAPGTYRWGRWRIEVGAHGTLLPGTAPYSLRARESGERYRPRNAPGHKRISRLLIDAKVPRALRDRPVICDRDGVVWAPPLAIAHDRPAPAPDVWRWRVELD